MSSMIEKALRKLHIGKRIFAVIAACIVIFTVVVLILSNLLVRRIMENNYFESDRELQQETAQSTQLLITDVNLLLIRLMGDEELYRILNNDKLSFEQKNDAFSGTVLDIIEGSQVEGIAMVDRDGRLFSATNVEGLDITPDEDTFDDIDKLSNHIGIYPMTFSESGKGYICLGRKYYFYSTSAVMGYMYAYVSEESLSKLITAPQESGVSMLVTDGGDILSSNDPLQIGKSMMDYSVFSHDGYRNYSIPYNNSEGILSVRRISELDGTLNTSLYTANIYSKSELFKSIDHIIFIVVIIEFCVMVLAIFIGFKNAKSIVKPIHRLQDNLENFGKNGELSPVYIEGEDEFSELEKTYNEMLSRIVELTRKNIDERLEQRKLQLDALQAQINPHFLYNTLDTIVWIAKIKKQKEIEDLAMALAGFFRISLHKGDKYIQVREELDFVKGYVLIQQIRFPNKFELVFDVSEEVLDCQIFKITIQPFVENAIKHGIAPKTESGCITVKGYRKNEDLVFEIIDDGVGIDKGGEIREQGELEGLHGYGIKNVDERLKLEYGEEYGVNISSVAGEGTTVTVKFPFIPFRPS